MAKNDDKYTDPELRNEIKEDVQASDKGGQPGQWSARKAQMMASEYKKTMHERGEEPYTTDKSEQSESQKHLSNWTKEEWQTSEGKGSAKQDDGTEQRYLPKKAWENMTEEEKEETNEKKLEGSARGEQHVSNTNAAKKARKDAQEEGENKDVADEEVGSDNGAPKSEDKDEMPTENLPKRGTKHKRNAKEREKAGDGDASDEGNAGGGEKEDDEEVSQSQPAAKKAKGDGEVKRITRSQSKTDSADANKKEAGDEKGDEEHGQPASATRLPKKGQEVHWRATPGWCEGTVVEVLHSEKDVDGIHAKASKGDPRIVLESSKSGKKAVHKPEAVYF